MIKLVCKDCGQVWYTANTRENQKCNTCGGALAEQDLAKPKSIVKESGNVTQNNKNCDCKIIYLNQS